MPEFDAEFEPMRLRILAQQYPKIVKTQGKVIFFAEDDEDRIFWARWFMKDENVMTQCSETGFKVDLMNLLDIFIQYRAQCNQLPKNAGVVLFGCDKVEIEWHIKASAEALLDND